MRFLRDWVSEHCGNWEKYLGHLKNRSAYGLEIGCFEGRSAAWFLENVLIHQNSRLYCVDNFVVDAHDMFLSNMRDGGFLEKIELFAKDSKDALKEIKEEQFFDFAYIDGDHTAFGALRDMVMVFDLLKDGGIMIVDDYTLKDKYSFPKPGIDAFLLGAGNLVEVLHKDKQVILRKK